MLKLIEFFPVRHIRSHAMLTNKKKHGKSKAKNAQIKFFLREIVVLSYENTDMQYYSNSLKTRCKQH